MSVNCIRCVRNERTSLTDLLCDECRAEASGKRCCQTCEHWGWTDWDGPGECWHPEAAEPGIIAYPDETCSGWTERKDKSSDGNKEKDS